MAEKSLKGENDSVNEQEEGGAKNRVSNSDDSSDDGEEEKTAEKVIIEEIHELPKVTDWPEMAKEPEVRPAKPEFSAITPTPLPPSPPLPPLPPPPSTPERRSLTASSEEELELKTTGFGEMKNAADSSSSSDEDDLSVVATSSKVFQV